MRWTEGGIEFEADPKHRQLIMETFGFDERSKGLVNNGEKDGREEVGDGEEMGKGEATEFRGVVARMNFLSQDCPDLQFPVKECSKQMSRPTKGAWKSAKKIARYLVRREKVVWRYDWQDESGETYTVADSDWGGNTRERKSTSGGAWFMGGHCIKTWSCTQGAFALSSAEAEFYAMIEAVVRSKGLKSLARELGFRNVSNVVVLGTDSSAAKSFVCRRGLGKMRHIEIRDLWLQKEVREGKLKVVKVMGRENPADLMTKILNIGEVEERLRGLNLTMVRRDGGAAKKLTIRDDDGSYRGDGDDDQRHCLLALFVRDCKEAINDGPARTGPGYGTWRWW